MNVIDNLRYTFDYCIFGFPDAKDVASTPCSTETACGDLQAALTGDRLSGENVDYSYCSADGGAMAGPAVEKCLACVGASDDQDFLANYVVALDAGCKQQPPTGTLVGLNDTVFSKTRIGATDPESDATDDDHAAMPIGTIIGIVIGAIVVVLVVAGIFFVCCRKRRNRRLRLEGSGSSRLSAQPPRDCPASPLSFRCQTHVTPRSPEFHRSITGTTIQVGEEKVFPGPYSATWASRPYSVSPVSPPMSPASMWPMPMPSPNSSSDDASRFSSSHVKQDRVALDNITTTVDGPKFPGYVHYSASPKASASGMMMAPFSPVDEDIAPPSTISTRSTAPLLLPQLKPYNPAEYASGSSAFSSPQQYQAAMGGNVSTPESTYASPTSGTTASPLLSRGWDSQHQRTTPSWDVPQQQQQRGPGRPNLSGAIGRATLVVAGKARRVSGGGSGSGNGGSSPVETTQINTVFAAPPTRR